MLAFSVIITCYNTLALIKKTLEAVLASTADDTEIILVNNHPPFPDVISFLQGRIHPRVRVVDPGCNLGPFDGQQYGRRQARGEYLVHVDDDTIVPSNDWLCAMRNALGDHAQLAYVSLPWEPAPPTNIKDVPVIKGSNYELAICNVDVPCTMLSAELWAREFSHLQMNRFYFGTRFYYYQRAKKIGRTSGYLISHWVHHLGRTAEADLLYGAWKVLYAKKITRKDYAGWRQQEGLTKKCIHVLENFGYPPEELLAMQELLKKPISRP